jgi:hypothetical protein
MQVVKMGSCAVSRYCCSLNVTQADFRLIVQEVDTVEYSPTDLEAPPESIKFSMFGKTVAQGPLCSRTSSGRRFPALGTILTLASLRLWANSLVVVVSYFDAQKEIVV